MIYLRRIVSAKSEQRGRANRAECDKDRKTNTQFHVHLAAI